MATFRNLFQAIAPAKGRLLVLTGSGVSAESGIPTFRGSDGYWVKGSVNYTPEEMATHRMFRRDPGLFWEWYLSRFLRCRAAQPNPAHRAIAAFDRRWKERFLLITQNIDGLHLRAGSPEARTYQIHGNVHFMRCGEECTRKVYPLPVETGDWRAGSVAAQPFLDLLRCPRCKALCRPQVLLFDEYYDEEFYRYQSSLQAAGEADLLVIAGTSGATALPNQIVEIVYGRGKPIIDINPERSVFSKLAEESGGLYIAGKAGEWLTRLSEAIGRP